MLRLHGPLTTSGIRVNWVSPDRDYSPDLLRGSDLVVIQRDYPRLVNQFLQLVQDAQELNLPIVFEIDDLLWELPPEHPDRISHYYTDALLPMTFAAWMADAVTVSTPEIEDYLHFLNPRIEVLQNYLNLSQWDFREAHPAAEKIQVNVGFIGGDSHLPDLLMVAPVLVELFEYYANRLKFTVWGMKPPVELVGNPAVEWKTIKPGDYQVYASHLLKQHELDIAIAPLQDSLFNRSKSSNKYLEYTALGLPVIASDLEPFARVIEPGVTGLLAKSLGDWRDHLRTLIENPDLRLEIARAAQETVRQNWLLGDHAHKWPQTYAAICDSSIPHTDLAQKLRLAKSILNQTTDQRKALLRRLTEKTRDVDRLTQELDAIKGSRSWKLIASLRGLFASLFRRN